MINRIAWNKGLTKKIDKRLDYKRPTSFKKGQVGYWLGKKRPNMIGNKYNSGQKIWNKGKKLSLAYREKLSKAHIGIQTKENHWNWKGGITEENHKIRTSIEYKEWRIGVLQRDRFSCINCGYRSKGQKTRDIRVDHIKPFSLYPELQ